MGASPGAGRGRCRTVGVLPPRRGENDSASDLQTIGVDSVNIEYTGGGMIFGRIVR